MTIQLKADLRDLAGGKAKDGLAEGLIPAVVYGSGADNKNVKVKKNDFEKTFAVAGEFNLIDLAIGDSQAEKVIVKDVQRDGITGRIIHVDFYRVNMAKKIVAEIPLNFIGEAKAVKDLGGTLVKNIDAVEIRCLPGDLVSHIDVDISKLAEFDQFIRLQDLVLPQGLELASETNEAVVGVVETKVEAEATIKPTEAEAAAVAAAETEAKDKEAGNEDKSA